MGRIRTLKPEFFRSRSLAKVSIPARLTFAGLWTEADDHGNGIADPDLLKGSLWPKDHDIDAGTIEAHLAELAGEHIALYEVDGERYYHVLRFAEHQAAAYRRGDPKHPPYQGARSCTSLHAGARESVLEGNEEGNREGKSASAATGGSTSSGKRKSPATPAPPTFEVTGDLRLWAADHAPRINLERETENFLDWHRANGKTKTDWVAAWRNWMRKAEGYLPPPSGGRRVPQGALND